MTDKTSPTSNEPDSPTVTHINPVTGAITIEFNPDPHGVPARERRDWVKLEHLIICLGDPGQ